MSAPPFPNEYLLRLVADSDSKACTVCYKPTTSVLVASNQGDFFYICPAHLKDGSFSSPIHPESYAKLLTEEKELEKKVVVANETAEANKPYSWNKIMTSMGWKSTKTTEEASKDAETKTKEKTYEALLAELIELKKQLATLKESIANFKFKNYKLNGDIYKMRINNHIQARVKAKRQQEMQDPSFFPSAPTTNLL